ncbi:LysR family transcriptional regulator [Falsiroseomonas sp. HW251]|uniref:LysR family transcriptional regulator n=1 Tax=Falsiroseomonas sp. HW251 TaxID=3390998 RepID=UPI003D31B7E9
MELWQARYALAVAETLSFRRAAELLGISQPPLSRAIAALEAELGVALFTRGPRGVAVTPAGETFRREATVLVAQGARTVAAVRSTGPAPVSLRIGFEGSSAHAVLPRALLRLRARHPDASITLREMSTTAQVRALKAEEIDVGLVVAPLKDPALLLSEVWREPLVLATSTDHPLARGELAAVNALATERFVIATQHEGCGLQLAIDALCRAAGFVPKRALETSDTMMLLDLVAAGVGVAILPWAVASRAGDCIATLPLRPAATVALVLAQRRGSGRRGIRTDFQKELAGVAAEATRERGKDRLTAA